MAAKSPKFIDVKGPEHATPSSTSRPIVVSNRSVLGGDPMVNSNDDSDERKTAEPITRTAKTIEPVSSGLDTLQTEEASPVIESSPEVDSLQDTPSTLATEESQVAPVQDVEPVQPETATEEPEPMRLTSRDAAAESLADEAKVAAEAEAAAARENELENLIVSGKYNAPINSSHRKRSRLLAVVLCIVALVLAAAIADAALDAGLLTVNGVPHTNILKDK